jgi:hypothetical protein
LLFTAYLVVGTADHCPGRGPRGFLCDAQGLPSHDPARRALIATRNGSGKFDEIAAGFQSRN